LYSFSPARRSSLPRCAGRRDAKDEVTQPSSDALPNGDEIGHRPQSVAELKLVTIGGRAAPDAGGANVPLPRRFVGRTEASPVQHVAVDGRQRLPRQNQLVAWRVFSTAQIEHALDQPIVVQGGATRTH